MIHKNANVYIATPAIFAAGKRQSIAREGSCWVKRQDVRVLPTQCHSNNFVWKQAA